MRPRRVLAAALVLAVVPLAGCSLRGEAWIEGEQLRVDLVVEHPRDSDPFRPCRRGGLPLGLEASDVERSEHSTRCRVSGTVDLRDADGVVGSLVALSDDHAFLRVPPLAAVREPAEAGLEAVDLAIHFPGEVVAVSSGGEVLGTTVRWSDAAAVEASGLSATARLSPGLPGWALPGGSGLVWGVTLAAATWWWRREGAPPAAPAPPGPDQPPPPPPPAPAAREDPSVWADDE